MKPLNNRKTLLDRFEKKAGLRFHRRKWLEAALTHPSYRKENPDGQLADFERLEFFGDAILNFVISEKLFTSFPEGNEGHLSQLRAALVSKKLLVRAAARIGLLPFILLGKNELQNPFEEKRKIIADTLEALIAAVYFDRGIREARSFVLGLFGYLFHPRHLKKAAISPKNALQEWVQKEFRTLPQYEAELKDEVFTARVKAENYQAKGKGRTKKEAEEKAAEALLRILKKKFKKKVKANV